MAITKYVSSDTSIPAQLSPSQQEYHKTFIVTIMHCAGISLQMWQKFEFSGLAIRLLISMRAFQIA